MFLRKPSRPISLPTAFGCRKSCHAAPLLLAALVACIASYSFDALAQSRAKIVKEGKCKVQIQGGDFQIGETVVFSAPINETESPPLHSVTILQRAKRKTVTWVGLLDKEQTPDCKQALGASLDEKQTAKIRRTPFYLDLELGLGQSRPGQKGLSWYAPTESQSIPALASTSVVIRSFPFFAMPAPFLSTTKLALGFQQDKTSQDGIADPSGAKNKLTVTRIDASFEFGVFIFGDAHPSGFSLGYDSMKLDSSASDSLFGRSIIRDFSCRNVMAGLQQGLFANGLFRFHFGLEQSLIATCKVEGIAEEQAFGLEAKQIAIGRSKEKAISASQISNPDGKLNSPSQFRLAMSASLFPVRYVGIGFTTEYSSWKAKLPTKSKTFDAKWTSFDYKLSLHAAF